MNDDLPIDPQSGLPYVVDATGVKRLLAKLAPNTALRAAFAAVPDMPQSEWREIDRRATLPLIKDQKSHGSCVGYSSAGALSRARALAGQPFVDLSGSYIYSFINGGRDQGATIHDAIQVLQAGVPPEELNDWSHIYSRQISDAAREAAGRYKGVKIYRVDTWAQFITALQLNFIPVGAVMVGGSFTSLDSNGVCGFDRGPGNHAVHFDGCRKIGGTFDADMVNSWNTSFGQQGRGFYTQRHFESVEQDCFAIETVTEDGGDGQEPPPVKL